MFDDVKCADQIVAAISDLGELRQGRAHHCPAKTLLGEGARFIVELETVDVPEALKHREIVPGAASELQNSGPRRGLDLSPDQLGEHAAPRAVPPMTVVELRHLLVNDP